MIASVAGLQRYLELVGIELDQFDSEISYLPLAHIFDRQVTCTCSCPNLIQTALCTELPQVACRGAEVELVVLTLSLKVLQVTFGPLHVCQCLLNPASAMLPSFPVVFLLT